MAPIEEFKHKYLAISGNPLSSEVENVDIFTENAPWVAGFIIIFVVAFLLRRLSSSSSSSSNSNSSKIAPIGEDFQEPQEPIKEPWATLSTLKMIPSGVI